MFPDISGDNPHTPQLRSAKVPLFDRGRPALEQGCRHQERDACEASRYSRAPGGRGMVSVRPHLLAPLVEGVGGFARDSKVRKYAETPSQNCLDITVGRGRRAIRITT